MRLKVGGSGIHASGIYGGVASMAGMAIRIKHSSQTLRHTLLSVTSMYKTRSETPRHEYRQTIKYSLLSVTPKYKVKSETI